MRLFVFIISLFSSFVFSQYKVPKGFIEINSSPANGRKIEKIKKDFDLDKKEDVISLVNNQGNDYILIYLSKSNKNILHRLIPCYDDFAIYPLQLEINKNDIVSYGYCCDGTSAFCRKFKIKFDNKKQNFVLFGYDSSYRLSSGHSEKSINLLTQNYIITNRDYFLSAENPTIETHKGKCIVKPIEINKIDRKFLDSIDSCGKKFEPQ